MDWIKLGRNVKYARARKGYTQAEVAELTGYSVQHLSHIENGTTKMSIDFMIALANTLEVSLDELFYDSLTIHKINDGYATILDGCSFEEKELISKVAIVIKEETEKFYK